MGATTDKISGVANKAAGSVKEAVGNATGNDKLASEGLAQQAKGDVQKAAGDVKSTVKKAVDSL